MVIERIERKSISLERTNDSLLEPEIIFISRNGTGDEVEEKVNFTKMMAQLAKIISERRELKRKQTELGKRRKTLEGGVTSKGKRYSSAEKRQINDGIKKEGNLLNLAKEKNARLSSNFLRRTKLLLASPPDNPLRVFIENDGETRLVSGVPLAEDETAFRLFIFQESPQIWNHPYVNLVREYFHLRRKTALEKGNSQEEGQLEEFSRQNVSLIPDELVPIFSKITKFDFRRSILTELEILEQPIR